MKIKHLLLLSLLVMSGCQTGSFLKPAPVPSPVSPPPSISGAGISSGGLIGGEIGSDLKAGDKQLGLNAEYKSLEFGKAGEIVAWEGEGSLVSGKVNAAQPYRVGSQDCRQYSHEIIANGASRVKRGTACRNGDGSWTLLD